MSLSIQSDEMPCSLVSPLDDNERLLDLISEVTAKPVDSVRDRLSAEERCLEHGIREEIRHLGIEPNVWSDDLAEFYRRTDTYLYACVVWNRHSEKLALRRWIGSRLGPGRSEPLRVLAFGDGPGFDSLYLAQCGHHVVYFDTCEFSREFAERIFRASGCSVQVATQQDELETSGYDVVTCLDVLEHVPQPEELVRQLHEYLRPGGRLFVSAPFALVSEDHPTHLRANARYSGSLRLYTRQGFVLVDGRLNWAPLMLVKRASDVALPPRKPLRLLALHAHGVFLAGGRLWQAPYCWLARMASGSDTRRMEQSQSTSIDRRSKLSSSLHDDGKPG